MKKRLGRTAIVLAITVAFAGVAASCGNGSGNTGSNASTEGSSAEASSEVNETPSGDYTVSYDGIETGSINAGVSVHDPSIIEVDGRYYIFGSHMTAAYSDDMRTWTNIGNGYNASNAVYTDLAYPNSGEFDYCGAGTSLIPTEDGGHHVWAPDVIYNEANGLYYMYYCVSSDFDTSALCFATAESVEGPYTWQKTLLYSGYDLDTISATDVLDYVDEEYAEENYIADGHAYNYEEYPNCIDPTVFYDADGRMWMVYGSWSGGIFILEIDEQTGEVIHPEADPDNNVDAYYGKLLIGGGHKSIEGPYILYDADAGYYYLYVSYGSLESDGGYQIRVFRSETPNGDYVDMNGKTPTASTGNHAYFGLKLSGNYFLPSLEEAYMATGHNSAMIGSDGNRYLCYHTRFDDGGEYHEPRVKQYFINEEGWPCVLPYATDGETISETGYDKSEVVGMYYFINQEMDISSKIAEPVMIELTEGGNVFGDGIEGKWTMEDGTYYMTITVDDVEYSGVFCEMNDEAGTDVMTFTAVGNNRSVWGVKYD